MPAGRRKAAFEPIAPDFDISALVENNENFQFVDRISCDMIDQQGLEAFDKLVLLHVVIAGKPLVIDGYQNRLDPWTFSSKWLVDNHGEKVESARDLTKKNSLPLTIGHYLKNIGKLSDQFFEDGENYKDTKSRQRIYLKDIDCPPVWQDKLTEHLPSNLFYLNENTGQVGGPGSVDEPAPTGGRRRGKGIAPAGDLMSSLPARMRADNLMCYIGHEGTYTPAHREMCASLGHNIMVEASETVGDDGKPVQPGSSIWFMTESKDRPMVQEYWLSTLGHDIEVENHFAQVAAWKRAPFTTYVVEQRPGDFILIPPLAPHQVWNRGTRTMKVAWNRTTIETLELAFQEALPNARMVCRDEQYKNKALVYYTLQKYSSLLMKARDQQQTAPDPQEAMLLRKSSKIRQLGKDFKRLFHLFREIMLSEMFSPDLPPERNMQFNPFDSNITCAYCRGNIFNRFLTCPSCEFALGTTEPEPYDICMECYAMGRSCGCVAKFRWAEQFKWKELAHKYELWRRQYMELLPANAEPPRPLNEERKELTKKTLAHVCQEQLKRRPKVDIDKPAHVESEEEEESDGVEIRMNEDGTVKKPKKKLSEAFLKKNWSCHVCCHRHERWKMVECRCGHRWCYGTLFRGFDTMPLTIMQDNEWRCPHCQNICISGQCKNDPRQKPYQPKGTLLGHDTKLVADARSIESLVDFGVSNISWLKESFKEIPDENVRLESRRIEAERAKAHDPSLENDHYATDDDGHGDNNLDEIGYEVSTIEPASQAVIDPALGGDGQPHDYVAPAALMYQPPDFSSQYEEMAEDDDADHQSVENPRKRPAESLDVTESIKRQAVTKKQRRSDANANNAELSGASKQFRKEQERKSLDEARKKGRYIMVAAAIKGRSKIVRLNINPTLLGNAIRGNTDVESNILIRSDVEPVESAQPQKSTPKAKSKTSKSVRILMERDEDFGSRRRRKSVRTDAQGKRIPKGYEEIEIASDSDGSQPDADGDDDDAEQPPASQDRQSRREGRSRRISAWQSQRHGGDEGLDELPENWKDGSARSKRTRPKSPNASKEQPSPGRQNTMAGKTLPGGLRVPQRGFVGAVESLSSSSSDAESNGEANGGANLDDADGSPTGVKDVASAAAPTSSPSTSSRFKSINETARAVMNTLTRR